jgi:predicted O-linked N-acetylglucosamine transferase (SPINDLY family)
MASPVPDISELFSRALALHEEGKTREAMQLCRRVLAADPEHFDAYHTLGLLHAADGDLVEAARALGHAVKLRPRDPQALSNLGNMLRAMGQINEALLFYETALTIDRNAPVVWYNRGLVLWDMRRYQDSLASHDCALNLNRNYPEAQLARVAPLRDMGRLEEALQSCDAASMLRPDWPEALNLRGSILWRMKRFDAALDSFNLALSHAPRSVEIVNNRGLALSGMDRHQDALESFDRAVALDPNYAEGWNNRGSALTSLQRFDEAIASFDKALVLRPGYAEALNNRGAVLLAEGRGEEALVSYAASLKAAPGNGATLYNQAVALGQLGRFAEALAGFEAVLAIHPRHPYALSGAAMAASNLCDWPKMATLKEQMVRAVADESAVIFPFTLLAYCDDPALQRRAAETYLADKRAVCAGPWPEALPPPPSKLKIAYVSADFGDHPVGRRMLPLLTGHDRSVFELHGISIGTDQGSPARQALAQSFDQFHDVARMSDREVVALMRAQAIDIAVDLTGHTQEGRPGIFAGRAAPVQVAYLGYPGTTGSRCMDYIFADAVVAPFAQQPFYSEAIVHLPGSFFPAGPDRTVGPPPSRGAAGLPDGGFVFCCFNQNWKITEEIFAVWMRLLSAVEGSVLWLAACPREARRWLEREAEARGVPASRIVWAERVTFEQNLARQQLADLMLDTLPYNAHATAADALLAGVPVLTCRGEGFAGRVAASLLEAAGLRDAVTDSLEAYEAVALKLARDPLALAEVKQTLMQNRAELFDLKSHVRALEVAYRHMRETTGGKGFTVTADARIEMLEPA